MFFNAYILSLVIIYCDREKYDYSGWRSVAKYNFTFPETERYLFQITCLLFVFTIIGWVSELVINFRQYNIIPSGPVINRNVKLFDNKNLVFPSLLILMIIVNVFMFFNKQGIVGVQPFALPYKLTGFLYYFRVVIYPLVAFYFVFIFRTYKISIASFLIIIAVVSGLLSVSRSLFVIQSFPLLFYFHTKKRYISVVVYSIFMLFILSLITQGRDFVYTNEFVLGVDDSLLIEYFNHLSSRINDSLVYIAEILKTLVMRTTGTFSYLNVVFNPIPNLHVSNSYFFSEFLGIPFVERTYFDAAKEIYRLNLPNNLSFGVAIDLFGYISLSTKNNFYFFLYLLFYVILMICNESVIRYLSQGIVRDKSLFILFSILTSFLLITSVSVKLWTIYLPIMLFLYKAFKLIRVKNEYKGKA